MKKITVVSCSGCHIFWSAYNLVPRVSAITPPSLLATISARPSQLGAINAPGVRYRQLFILLIAQSNAEFDFNETFLLLLYVTPHDEIVVILASNVMIYL